MIAKVHEAKSQLSKLLDAAERGEEVFITRRGSRFRVTPAPLPSGAGLYGILRGALPEGREPDYDDADRALDSVLDEYFESQEDEL